MLGWYRLDYLATLLLCLTIAAVGSAAMGCTSVPPSQVTGSDVCALELPPRHYPSFGPPVTGMPNRSVLEQFAYSSLSETSELSEYYADGCEAGDTLACTLYGLSKSYVVQIREDGRAPMDVIQHQRAGIPPLFEACQAGFGPACTQLFMFRLSDDEADTDGQEIYRLLQRGCSRGDGEACIFIGGIQFPSDEQIEKMGWERPMVRERRRVTVAMLERACLQGSMAGCHHLGRLALRENEDHQCYDKLATLACERGNIDACVEIATLDHAMCEHLGDDHRQCHVVDAIESLDHDVAPVPIDHWVSTWVNRCNNGELLTCHIMGRLAHSGYLVGVDADDAAGFLADTCQRGIVHDCEPAALQFADAMRDEPRRDWMEQGLQAAWKGCDEGLKGACEAGARLAYEDAYDLESDAPPDLRRRLLRRACNHDTAFACSVIVGYDLSWVESDDLETAIEVVSKRCDEESPEHCLSAAYGHMKLDGFDSEAGRQLLRNSCDHDSLIACEQLSHLEDDSTPTQWRTAGDLEDACREGEAAACHLAGGHHNAGLHVPRDRSRAVEYWKRGCEDGHPHSCIQAGNALYLDSNPMLLRLGIASDEKLEVHRRGVELAERGCSLDESRQHCVNYALMLLMGIDEIRDIDGGIELLDESCKGGNPSSCRFRAQMGLRLDDIDYDTETALANFEAACEGEDYDSCVDAGLIYRFGDGDVEAKPRHAHHLFEKACHHGNQRGCTVRDRHEEILSCREDGHDNCTARANRPADVSCGPAGGQEVSRQAFHNLRGANITELRELDTSRDRPVEVCGIQGQQLFLNQLRCRDGSHAFRSHDDIRRARVGNVGQAGRCNETVDHYRVRCPENTYDVYIDGYWCPEE